MHVYSFAKIPRNCQVAAGDLFLPIQIHRQNSKSFRFSRQPLQEQNRSANAAAGANFGFVRFFQFAQSY